MKNIVRAFRRIPETNRTIAFGFVALVKNLFYFLFKLVVGIIFQTPLLIAIAIYSLTISIVKANCSRGLLRNKDSKKDCNTFIINGVILFVISTCFIIYSANIVDKSYGIKYNLIIAIIIALFASWSMVISIMGLFRTRGRTMLVKEFRLTNFANALINLVLTQIAILSFMNVSNMNTYNSIFAIIIGSIILLIGVYLIIYGLIQHKVYTTGITNKKYQKN